jgi:hypothetical protein
LPEHIRELRRSLHSLHFEKMRRGLQELGVVPVVFKRVAPSQGLLAAPGLTFSLLFPRLVRRFLEPHLLFLRRFEFLFEIFEEALVALPHILLGD